MVGSFPYPMEAFLIPETSDSDDAAEIAPSRTDSVTVDPEIDHLDSVSQYFLPQPTWTNAAYHTP